MVQTNQGGPIQIAIEDRLVEVREGLRQILGQSFRSYINTISNFINGRICRDEFEGVIKFFIKETLPNTELASLHNKYVELLLELIGRISVEVLATVETDSLKPARLFPHQFTLSKADEQIFVEAKNRQLVMTPSDGMENKRLVEELAKSEKSMGRLLLSQHSSLLPDGMVLRERLMAASRAFGMDDGSIDQEMVQILSKSLEEHLEKIFEDCIQRFAPASDSTSIVLSPEQLKLALSLTAPFLLREL